MVVSFGGKPRPITKIMTTGNWGNYVSPCTRGMTKPLKMIILWRQLKTRKVGEKHKKASAISMFYSLVTIVFCSQELLWKQIIEVHSICEWVLIKYRLWLLLNMRALIVAEVICYQQHKNQSHGWLLLACLHNCCISCKCFSVLSTCFYMNNLLCI